ncbi:MAG: SCO family protein [Cytophagaceae bacterium]|nr:SCO family protein [Cytophagaceae bacterium]MBK9933089.1 SCO family protein [Cytophagaceae bacterium]MBL0303193.1 SCO family protein [Cytophagaceae bacterium]MBL0326044.1 SCO family protein [Cytophagaceae bacterium]
MRKSSLLFFIFTAFSALLWSCGDSNRTLPYLGQNTIDSKGDTIYHQIPDFAFVNQDGDTLTQDFFKDKIYIADFFFTTCPTICPVMKTQMLRIHEKFGNEPRLAILSHTIDPRHDTVAVLKKYKEKLGVKSDQWQFVTGEQAKIYEIAQKSYMVSALEDSTAVEEGGFVHSGAFVLVDQNHRIRGVYDGTKEIEVNKLMKDIELLLKK